MKLIKFLSVMSITCLLLISNIAFASNRIAHTKPVAASGSVQYYNDVAVVNYTNLYINLAAHFFDGTIGYDTLHPYGSPGNSFVDYIDLYNDPYAYLVLQMTDGAIIFSGKVYKGQEVDIKPGLQAAQGKQSVIVNVK